MILLALLLALLLGSAATAQDEVARQKQFSMPPLSDELAAELLAVGRVNKGGFNIRGSCSGTLIAPDVVLTAGHCAGPVRQESKSARMFVAGWSRGDYVAAREIVEAVRHPAYFIGNRHDPRYDVGLLFLDTPITETAPLRLAEPREDAAAVGIAGYHRFIPHLLSGRLDCPVLERSMQLIRVDCPVVSGNSGGPMLEPDGSGGWQVTGVVSSQERGAEALSAIVVRLPGWVHDVLAERQVSRY